MFGDEKTSVPVRLANNAVIRVETVSSQTSGDADVAAFEANEIFEVDTIQSAIEGIGEMVTSAFSKLAPSKASAEFAIEVGVESGKLTALWVKGTGKANLKITLEWNQHPG